MTLRIMKHTHTHTHKHTKHIMFTPRIPVLVSHLSMECVLDSNCARA
jgi:hypothetical protein